MAVAFGLNRWDWRTPASFAAQVAEAEAIGLDWAFLPVNPLAVPDPYALMAAGAAATTTMRFGPLLETPQLRPPALAAGSIATIAKASGGRAMLSYGVGDTAVRYLGMRPSRIAELEAATRDARALLAGEQLDVGAKSAAFLRHASPAPVWVAAGGPKTLRMAGSVADGVWIRAGIHPTVISNAVALVHEGARSAGRDPSEVDIGLIVHTVRSKDPSEIRLISRAMAAGFHEYSPALFEQAGLTWDGPPVHELQQQVDPDFHHAADLVAAGEVVSFLSDEAAASFSFHGSDRDIRDQLDALLAAVPSTAIVVPHPVPMPMGSELLAYVHWMADTLFR